MMPRKMTDQTRKRRHIVLHVSDVERAPSEQDGIPLKPKSAAAQKMLETARLNPMNTLFMAA